MRTREIQRKKNKQIKELIKQLAKHKSQPLGTKKEQDTNLKKEGELSRKISWLRYG